MKKTILACLMVFGSVSAFAGDHYVNGYVRKDGKYVNGYERTAPDETTTNNYSTKGNVNPYTGKEGTKPVVDENPYAYKPYKPLNNDNQE